MGLLRCRWGYCSYFFLTIILLAHLVRRHTPLKLVDWSLTKYLIAILIGSALMGFVLLYLASHNVNVILKVLLGVLVYAACVIPLWFISQKKANPIYWTLWKFNFHKVANSILLLMFPKDKYKLKSLFTAQDYWQYWQKQNSKRVPVVPPNIIISYQKTF